MTLAAAQAQETPPPQSKPEPQRIRITFVGDVLLEAHWKQPAVPAEELWQGVKQRFSEANVVAVNLEEPLTNSNTRTRYKNPKLVAVGRDYILRAVSPDAAKSLRDAGVGVASLANNHTMDYGERGMQDTLKQLAEAGVPVVGGGEDLSAATKVLVLEVRGVRIGFLAFSDVVPPGYEAGESRPGINSAKDLEHVRQSIAAAHEEVDFLAIIFHWGIEKARTPSSRQKELARIAQQAGADIILGAHPHNLQGVGCAAKAPVIYSAGNFLFPSTRAAARRTVLFEIELERVGENSKPALAFVRLVPALIDERGAPQIVAGSAGNSILNEMARLSHDQGASVNGDRIRCGGSPPSRVRRGRIPAKK